MQVPDVLPLLVTLVICVKRKTSVEKSPNAPRKKLMPSSIAEITVKKTKTVKPSMESVPLVVGKSSISNSFSLHNNS
jgi:hypothetical protein